MTPTAAWAPAGASGSRTADPPSRNAAAPVNAMTTTSAARNRFRVRRSTLRVSGRGRAGPDGAGPGAARSMERRPIGAAGARVGTRLVGGQVELPQRAERIHAPGGGRRESRPTAAPIDENDALDDVAAHRFDRGKHGHQ